MTTEQQLLSTDHPLFEVPTNWPARRDYRRAQRLAQALELEECQAVFLDKTPRNSARYRWGIFYPLACLPVLAAIILLFSFVPVATLGWLFVPLLLLLVGSIIYIFCALILVSFDTTSLHCEQIHLYTYGFVAIDARGRRQGARWDQLFDFRRGGHEDDRPAGRVHWDILRAAIANRRPGQRHTLKITPQLPDSTEICARIERAYTTFWLPLFQEQFSSGATLDFDALLLQRDCLGKTTPGDRRYSASVPRSATPPTSKISVQPGMARGLVTQTGASTSTEWLRRGEVKSIRIDERYILIRTLEPVRRDKQGRADRLWFQLDTLALKDAAILRELLSEFTAR